MSRAPLLPLALAALAAGCSSSPDPEPGLRPEAPPLAADRAREAVPEPAAAEPRNTSTSRVLAYVNGDVVTYRDVLLRIGPQLAVVEGEDARARLEDDELMTLLRERVLWHAARDAQLEVTRDEFEKERERRVRDIGRSGGTLEAFLAERSMTRREFDEQIRKDMAVERFLLAAIGQGDQGWRVRAMTDTYVSPGECQRYYERNPDRFRQEAGAKVRVFTIPADLEAEDREAAVAAARATAERVRARLAAGEDPVPVYRELNRDAPEPDTSDGLQLVQRGGSLAEWICDFAFERPRGTVSEVIQKGRTFYVLYAEGSQEERQVPFDEVQNRIRQGLHQVRRQVAAYEVELALLEDASIRPEGLKGRLRDMLRGQRRKLSAEAGL